MVIAVPIALHKIMPLAFNRSTITLMKFLLDQIKQRLALLVR
jgi:hypothetical protein